MVKTSADRFQIGPRFEAMVFKRKNKELNLLTMEPSFTGMSSTDPYFSYRVKHPLLLQGRFNCSSHLVRIFFRPITCQLSLEILMAL
jgi:hypothetical protein